LQNSSINSEVSQIVQGRYIVVFKDLVENPAAEARMMGSNFGLTVGIYTKMFLKDFRQIFLNRH